MGRPPVTVLAIDQGTTSTRALLVDAAGRTRIVASLPHRQIYPGAGMVEHDPEALLANLRACLDAAGAIAVPDAVGIDNQGESCLAWDADTGRAVSPVLVWQDDRTRAMADALRADGVEAEVLARAGLPLDPYFSATKFAWILREIPEARRLAAQGRLRLGTTDAFFRDRLTGHFQTDVTTASRTALMNLDTCDWDPELCRIFGVPLAALPRIGASTGDFGTVSCAGHPVPLTASLVDQQAALYGHGCRRPGDAKMTFGTGGFALAVTGRRIATGGDGPLATIAWQKAGAAPVYALDGGVYCASSAVNWARGLGLFDDYAAIRQFEAPLAISRGLVFVPALAGLACPHWDRRARGAWMGLSLDTTPADMMQALLEGVAFRMAEVVDTMTAHQPLTDPVSIDGGMAANDYFCQMLADCLGRPVMVQDEPELTAVGTAALAAEAVGQAIASPRPGLLVTPRPLPPGLHARFQAARVAVQAFGAA